MSYQEKESFLLRRIFLFLHFHKRKENQMRFKGLIIFSILLLVFTGCGKKETPTQNEVKVMKKKISQFKPSVIKYEKEKLTENERKVIENLYKASKVIDRIFLEQVYYKNLEIEKKLSAASDELGKLQYEYFKIMFGPFDRLDHDKPFYGNEPKPKGANFYPYDMTKAEFENWLKAHPEDEESFTSERTVIRREGKNLVAIPYPKAYEKESKEISNYLKEAAKYAENPSLKKYLLSRAEAFLTNDYFQSDMDWMDLKNHTIEAVIGPYEVYEDGLFNYKAAFESFVTIVDKEESRKLEKFGKYLTELEKNLPIPDKYKNFNRGKSSPIVVVNEVFNAGDAKAGVQTLAFNLPNDERVRKAKGSKKVMLKNIHEAKYQALLKPIAERVLDGEFLKDVTFDAFFTHTLMHEISHGLGPGFITVNGRNTEVKRELKETYSTIEECKADVLGMFNNIFMIEKKELPQELANQLWATFLASVFRSVRFGINEAHGSGNAIIFNYLLENGAYIYDEKTTKFKINYDKIYDVVKSLANKLLIIQAQGDYAAAKKLIADYVKLSPEMEVQIKKLKDLPVDIKPVFEIEKIYN